MSDLRPVRETIGRVARVPAVDETVLRARAVWLEAVGEQVAANSVPVRMSGNALLVNCSSSTWAAELRMLSGSVAARLTTMMEQPPAELRFEVGRVDRQEHEVPPPPLPPATDEQRTTADRMAASVADADLRAQVREAVLLSLQRSS